MTVDVLKAKIEMHKSLSRGLNDEFGSNAKVTKIDAVVRSNGGVLHLSFVVCADALDRILRGQGGSHNEIMAALRSNMEECYNDKIERLNLYHLCEPAPETDGAGGRKRCSGSIERVEYKECVNH